MFLDLTSKNKTEIIKYVDNKNLYDCNKYLYSLKYYKFNTEYSLQYYDDAQFRKLVQLKIPKNKLSLNLSACDNITDKTLRETNVFCFVEPKPQEFWSLESITFKDFETELLYLKLFTKTNISQEPDWTYTNMTKCTSIIKLSILPIKFFICTLNYTLKLFNSHVTMIMIL